MQCDTAAAIVYNILNGLKCTTVPKLEWGIHTSILCYHHQWDFVKLLISKNSCVCRERRKRIYLPKKKFIVTLMGHFKNIQLSKLHPLHFYYEHGYTYFPVSTNLHKNQQQGLAN